MINNLRSGHTYYIKRYILLNIFTDNWKPGDKLPSAQQISIKLHIGISTIKQVLNLFVSSGVIQTKPKIGYYLNDELFDILPMSIRKKYSINFDRYEFIKEKPILKMTKIYTKNNKRVAYVQTELIKDIFKHSRYDKNKTFMHNLAYHGYVITQIHSLFYETKKDGVTFMLEKRTLFDEKNNMIAKEKIYVLCSLWKERKIFKI